MCSDLRCVDVGSSCPLTVSASRTVKFWLSWLCIWIIYRSDEIGLAFCAVLLSAHAMVAHYPARVTGPDHFLFLRFRSQSKCACARVLLFQCTTAKTTRPFRRVICCQ